MNFIEKWIAKIAVKKLIDKLNIWIMGKSWKTTAAGIGALLVGIGTFTVSLLNPELAADAGPLFEALKGLGVVVPIWLIGLFSRDKDVTSEDEGLQTKKK